MALYSVVLPSGAYSIQDGNNAVIVHAGNATDAKAQAAAYSGADGAPWLSATATLLAPPTALAGLKIAITIAADVGNDGTFDGEDLLYEYIVPAGAATDTVDEIGALIIAELNALPQLAGVTYTSGTDTILIGEANNCGLAAITAKTYVLGGDGQWFESTSQALTVGAVGGDASSDRTIVITPLTSGVIPAFVTGYKA